MNWPSFYLSWFLSFLMAWTPFAAHGGNSASAAPRAERAETSFRHLPDRTQIIQRSADGKELIAELPRSSEAELRKTSPNTLARQFAQGMKASQPLESLKHTTQRFPRESFLFFVAIGGVTMYQLATDYSSNPMRMKHHLDHSLSPLGMFSFYSFMYANGLATNALSVWLKNPKYHSFIPYLGMTAGFFVSSTISTFAADPNVGQCVKQMLGKATAEPGQPDPCETAFSWYVIKGHLYTLAPGLVSMLASTLMAGLIQKGLTAGIYKLTGVDIAFLFMPGGVGIQSVRFLLVNLAQMGLFFYLDAVVFHHYVTGAYRNVFDSMTLNRLEWELGEKITAKKKSAWRDDNGGRTLTDSIKEFQKQSGEWRMMNLMKIHEAHHGWQEKLSRFSAQYHTAFEFYNDFIAEVHNSRYELLPTQMRRLDISYPLLGVTPKDVTADKQAILYHRPAFYENAAAETAVTVGQWLTQRVESAEFKALSFGKDREAFLKKTASVLSNGSPDEQGRAIAEVIKALSQARASAPTANIYWMQELQTLRAKLGQPNPSFENGLGFLSLFDAYSPHADKLKSANFPKLTSGVLTPRVSEHLLMQMACGPDVDRAEALVTDSIFSAASFVAPKIITPHSQDFLLCRGRVVGAPSMPKSQDTLQLAATLKEVKSRIRPEILGGKESSGFLTWWESKVEPSVKAGYEKFAEQYEDIVKTLVTTLNGASGDSFFNHGPLGNGVREATEQELRLSLMILGELLKDRYAAEKGAALPLNYFSPQRDPEPDALRKDPAYPSWIRFIPLLRKKGSLEWNRLARSGATIGHSLQFQRELESEFEKMTHLLSRIRIQKMTDGKERIVSDFDNDQIQEQTKAIETKLAEVVALLGASDEKAGLITLTAQQKGLVTVVATGLKTLANELAMYGLISNAVNWEKSRKGNTLSPLQQKMLQQVAGPMTAPYSSKSNFKNETLNKEN